MKQYVVRRVALAVPTLFVVSVLVFALMRMMPGDVATRMVEGHAYAPTLAALRHDLGLDRPVHVQYLDWIGGIVLRGDFGRSYWTRQPILEEFVRRFPVTLELALLTIVVSVAIGVTVGIVALVYGLIEAPDKGWLSASTLIAFGISIVVLTAFNFYERWVDEPMLVSEENRR